MGICTSQINPPLPVTLPDDLIAEVLSFLDGKSLIRLKCVSKSWYSLKLCINLWLSHLIWEQRVTRNCFPLEILMKCQFLCQLFPCWWIVLVLVTVPRKIILLCGKWENFELKRLGLNCSNLVITSMVSLNIVICCHYTFLVIHWYWQAIDNTLFSIIV